VCEHWAKRPLEEQEQDRARDEATIDDRQGDSNRPGTEAVDHDGEDREEHRADGPRHAGARGFPHREPQRRIPLVLARRSLIRQPTQRAVPTHLRPPGLQQEGAHCKCGERDRVGRGTVT
jgi:hypothetical protein